MSNPDNQGVTHSRPDAIPDRNLYVRIIRACQTVIEPSTWRRCHLHDAFWRLYRNEEDGATVTTPEGIVPLRAGFLYILPSHLQIDLNCDRRISHFYAHFDVAGLPAIAMRELFHAPLEHPYEAHHERILDMSSVKLSPEWPDLGQPVSVTTQCCLKTLIYELLSHHLQSTPPEQMDYCWHLAERIQPVLAALDLIESCLAESLSNLRLATSCSMSEGHFIRKFHACLGLTPTQYVLERRIKRATQRLLLTTDSIEKIAAECGFGSRDYFSRVFTHHTGIPPASFRRAHFRDIY